MCNLPRPYALTRNFTGIVLRPQVLVSADSDPHVALRLHEDAHHECFIANSVNVPVHCEAVIQRKA